MEKRVAVTCLGVLSCIGNDVKTFWDNLVNGVCGIDYITEYPTENLAVKIGGMVRDFHKEHLENTHLKHRRYFKRRHFLYEGL